VQAHEECTVLRRDSQGPLALGRLANDPRGLEVQKASNVTQHHLQAQGIRKFQEAMCYRPVSASPEKETQ
jgi:hypothetical protein